MSKIIWLATGFAICGLGAGTAFGEDYSAVKVVEQAIVPDLMTGVEASGLGTILSPDGSRAVHLGAEGTCLYDIVSLGEWTKVGCAPRHPEVDARPTAETLWSADAAAVLLPTTTNVIMRYWDGDVATFDPATLSVNVLTADGIDKFEKTGSGFIDTPARWLDGDTIVFVRSGVTDGRIDLEGRFQLMTLERDGSGLTPLIEMARTQAGFISSLAPSPDGRTIVYSLDTRDAEQVGLWLYSIGDTEPVRIVAGHRRVGIHSVSYSADGKKLLMITADKNGLPIGTVFDIASATFAAVSAEPLSGIGWAPTGHAMVYLTADPDETGKDVGLYVTPEPGEPGYRVLDGQFFSAACCHVLPLPWTSNDRLLLSNATVKGNVIALQLGR